MATGTKYWAVSFGGVWMVIIFVKVFDERQGYTFQREVVFVGQGSRGWYYLVVD